MVGDCSVLKQTSIRKNLVVFYDNLPFHTRAFFEASHHGNVRYYYSCGGLVYMDGANMQRTVGGLPIRQGSELMFVILTSIKHLQSLMVEVVQVWDLLLYLKNWSISCRDIR